MKKLKVLHLIKYSLHSNGGMESYLNNIIKYLNINFNFTIFSFSKNNKNEFQIFQNSKYILVKPLFYFKSQPISFKLKSLNEIIQQNDIIHLHFPFPIFDLFLFFNLRLLKNKLFIITWHANLENTRWKYLNPIYKIFYNKLLNRADKIIVTNESIIDNNKLLKNFINKLFIIPIGIDLHSNYLPKNIYNKDAFSILFVGKLRLYKGLNYLVKAFSFLPQNYMLNIIGNGEEYDNINEIILENNLIDRVKIYDNVDNKELSKFYINADLFVLPSISEAEAFGIVQLEAMSYGLPIINTNLNSGVPKISIHNYTGFTITPKSINELAKSILRITSNQDLYFQFSKNCLDHVRKFNNIDLNYKIMDLYSKHI
jgi:glycosyltransferase involved in cell wall biosynthesis